MSLRLFGEDLSVAGRKKGGGASEENGTGADQGISLILLQ